MKREVALLLALVMVLGMGTPAFAAETDVAEDMPEVVGTPAPDAVETPAPDAAESPNPETTESPNPEAAESPNPEATENPEPDAAASPEPDAAASPEPDAAASPEPDAAASPEPDALASPEPDAAASPEPEATASPEPEATASPEPEATASPEPEATASPSPTPVLDTAAWLGELGAVAGRVDISISKAMDFGEAAPVFSVGLSRDGTQAAGDDAVAADGTVHSFSLPEAGDYELTVKGPGFALFTQTIHVDMSECALVKLTAGRLSGYETGAHPGVLQIGDVDGDGDVDDDDRSLMMRSVAAGGPVDGCWADLNMDGAVTLADAEYLAKGRLLGALDASQREATVERFVPAEMLQSAASVSTLVTGDMGDLFRDNGQSVQLGTMDGQPISAGDPVAVSIGVPAGSHMDTILLEDTNIASGEITISYTDEYGAEHVAKGVIGTAPAPIYNAPAAEPSVQPAAELPADEGNTAAETSAGEAVPADAGEPAGTQGEIVPEEVQQPEAGTDVPAEGETLTIGMPDVPGARMPRLRRALFEPLPMVIPEPETVQVVPDGMGGYRVDLGGKKAVKRVTLTITGTEGGLDLAKISQVEFVNGMENRIPEPQLDIPVLYAPVEGSRAFTVSWQPCVNITGYEVMVTAAGGAPEVIPLTGTSLTVTSYGGRELVNYTAYTVQVQSVNGAWASGYGQQAVTVTPKPTAPPDKPDNVRAVGGYQSVTVSWKNMKDTTGYDVYYKELGAAAFTTIPDVKANSCLIEGLRSDKPTTYVVYVVGKNELGESAPSMQASADTVTLSPPQMPRFNLINRDSAGNPGPSHITAATQASGVMVASPMDAASGTAWGTVDGNAASYYDRKTWDDGGYNGNLGAHLGLVYTFDSAYEMDTIGMMSAIDPNMDYTYVKIRWWDAAGEQHILDRGTVRAEERTDGSGKRYTFLRLPEPITATQLQICTARYYAGNNRISVSEVYFYKYDSLKRELAALYADDLHTVLADTVTEQLLDELQARINASVDEFGNENPDKAQLLRELDTARKIYRDQFLGKVIAVHSGITAAGDEHGFGGLNAWQPLGVTAAAGETVTVYVGHSTKKTGESTQLQLVATQYHAEAGAMSKVVVSNLRIGTNEIKLPKIWTTTGVESGGALYVQYTGGSGAGDSYAVRVSGGTQVPVLDLYRVSDPGERQARTAEYLAALQSYAADITSLHASVHQGEGSVSREVAYDYNERTCILGATDIMLDTMMLSLPAQQIIAGCGGSAQTLLASLDAMENMMNLFYQHKGLNANAPDAADRIPFRHLNIRYQRMFSGAFMYASGDHIGIEWPETAGMASCGGVAADALGRYVSGNYFGWGIAHEIGHDINQSCYAIAEITNNFFAVLAQAQDNNESVRFQYKDVYEKVTSGVKGPAGNVFTQLAMYWQLHLAYDKGYNFKTYADYNEQFNSLFYARVDTYARTPSKAPGTLTLAGADVDQTIMRLACAAAEKDLLDFFERWGKTPDETTVAYASQFEKESRAICYASDDARRYVLEHGGASRLAPDGTTTALTAVMAAADPGQANRVNIAITPGGTVPAEEILGYEIVRCTIAAGKVEKRTVGFATQPNFTDTVYAMNNRSVYYEIVLVDKYLNRSAAALTGSVKIQHKGDLDKNGWSVTTAGLTADRSDAVDTGGDKDMPEIMEENVALRIADGKAESVYRAAVGENASIQLDFGQTCVVTGFSYVSGGGTPIGGYRMDVRQNGQWTKAAEGTLDGDKTVYFANPDGKYVSTYAADAMRLTLTGQVGQTVSVAELGALGPAGDNVGFSRDAAGQAAIGYLSEAFRYGDEPQDVIPAGSLVFTGSYAGNAAYNTVVLYDQDGRIVAAGGDGRLTAYQIILADVPENGPIQDVRDGIWIYWIQPEDLTMDFQLPQRVRVELYRVNNPQFSEGQRLVSDSLFVDVPQQPGSITLSANG